MKKLDEKKKMLTDEIIRNKIQKKISGKKVHNISYLTACTGGRSVYAICGNNNKIFGHAVVSSTLDIEEIIL